MPNGPAHAAAADNTFIAVAIPATVAGIAYHPAMLGMVAGALLGKISDPDLDHWRKTQSEHRVWRFNVIAGFLWSAFWWPYQKLSPHRGISHTWPYGTLIRFLYLLWLPIALSLWYGDAVLWLCWWMLVFVGLSIQDAVHLWMDGEL